MNPLTTLTSEDEEDTPSVSDSEDLGDAPIVIVKGKGASASRVCSKAEFSGTKTEGETLKKFAV